MFRTALFAICSAVFLAGPLGAQNRAARAPAKFFFMHLSDPQLGMFDDNKSIDRDVANLRGAVAHVNRLKPAFVVFTGDLVNKPGDPKQLHAYLKGIRAIDPSIPVHSVAGNHDVENAPTAESLRWFREKIGPDREVFTRDNVWFLALNSSLFFKSDHCAGEADEQMAWLERTLGRAKTEKARQIVLFQHHPWFVGKPDEPADYHNIPEPRRSRCLKLLADTGVRATFAGHLHRNAETRAGAMEIVASGPVGKPIGNDPSGIRVVWVFEDRIEHAYYALDLVPERIALTGPVRRARI